MNSQWSVASGEGDSMFSRDSTDAIDDNKEGDLFIPPSWHPDP